MLFAEYLGTLGLHNMTLHANIVRTHLNLTDVLCYLDQTKESAFHMHFTLSITIWIKSTVDNLLLQSIALPSLTLGLPVFSRLLGRSSPT